MHLLMQSYEGRGMTVLCGCAQVIRQLVDHNRHRVYVVDDSDRAVGVVTPTDVLRLITS